MGVEEGPDAEGGYTAFIKLARQLIDRCLGSKKGVFNTFIQH